MSENRDEDSDDSPPEHSEYQSSSLAEDGHKVLRRCAACGSADMAPEAAFDGTTIGSSHEHGLDYRCPACGAQAQIPDSGTIFMGGVYTLFWGAIGVWALWSGPLWYLRHIGYFTSEFDLPLMVFDAFFIVFTLAVAAFAAWFIWLVLVKPARTLMRHPVTGETGEKSPADEAASSATRRGALLSLFVYPAVLWVPLIATIWVLDQAGVDVRANDFAAYAALAILLAAAAALAKWLNARTDLMIVGMVLWLAGFVGLVFWWG